MQRVPTSHSAPLPLPPPLDDQTPSTSLLQSCEQRTASYDEPASLEAPLDASAGLSELRSLFDRLDAFCASSRPPAAQAGSGAGGVDTEQASQAAVQPREMPGAVGAVRTPARDEEDKSDEGDGKRGGRTGECVGGTNELSAQQVALHDSATAHDEAQARRTGSANEAAEKSHNASIGVQPIPALSASPARSPPARTASTTPLLPTRVLDISSSSTAVPANPCSSDLQAAASRPGQVATAPVAAPEGAGVAPPAVKLPTGPGAATTRTKTTSTRAGGPNGVPSTPVSKTAKKTPPSTSPAVSFARKTATAPAKPSTAPNKTSKPVAQTPSSLTRSTRPAPAALSNKAAVSSAPSGSSPSSAANSSRPKITLTSRKVVVVPPAKPKPAPAPPFSSTALQAKAGSSLAANVLNQPQGKPDALDRAATQQTTTPGRRTAGGEGEGREGVPSREGEPAGSPNGGKEKGKGKKKGKGEEKEAQAEEEVEIEYEENVGWINFSAKNQQQTVAGGKKVTVLVGDGSEKTLADVPVPQRRTALRNILSFNLSVQGGYHWTLGPPTDENVDRLLPICDMLDYNLVEPFFTSDNPPLPSSPLPATRMNTRLAGPNPQGPENYPYEAEVFAKDDESADKLVGKLKSREVREQADAAGHAVAYEQFLSGRDEREKQQEERGAGRKKEGGRRWVLGYSGWTEAGRWRLVNARRKEEARPLQHFVTKRRKKTTFIQFLHRLIDEVSLKEGITVETFLWFVGTANDIPTPVSLPLAMSAEAITSVCRGTALITGGGNVAPCGGASPYGDAVHYLKHLPPSLPLSAALELPDVPIAVRLHLERRFKDHSLAISAVLPAARRDRNKEEAATDAAKEDEQVAPVKKRDQELESPKKARQKPLAPDFSDTTQQMIKVATPAPVRLEQYQQTLLAGLTPTVRNEITPFRHESFFHALLELVSRAHNTTRKLASFGTIISRNTIRESVVLQHHKTSGHYIIRFVLCHGRKARLGHFALGGSQAMPKEVRMWWDDDAEVLKTAGMDGESILLRASGGGEVCYDWEWDEADVCSKTRPPPADGAPAKAELESLWSEILE